MVIENQNWKIKEKLKLAALLFGLMLAVMLQIPAVSASEGCCFTKDDGLCWPNSEEADCAEPNGEFYDGRLCSAVSECGKGCCIIGINARYDLTYRGCELLSRASGFELDFRGISEDECSGVASSFDIGACVIPGDYENTCKYTTREKCGDSENFHAGVLCSEPSLNTICKKTEETICHKESVYYTDSCGNTDAEKEACDLIGKGNVCKQETKTKAICKNVDCKDKKEKIRKHGESWCALDNFEYDGGIAGIGSANIADVIKYSYKIGDYRLEFTKHNTADVYKGGEIYDSSGTQVCGFDANENIRHAVNKGVPPGPALCKEGHGEQIEYTDGNGDKATTYADGYYERADMQVSGTYRGIFQNCGDKVNLGAGQITALTTTIESYMGANTPVGSRYFSKYCYDGEIKTDACGEGRTDYCIFGQCVRNNGDLCYGVKDEEECNEVGECNWIKPVSSGKAGEEISCSSAGALSQQAESTEIVEITAQDLLDDLEIGTCAPKISIENVFWAGDEGHESQEELDQYCSIGNAEIKILFDHDKGDCWMWTVQEGESGAEISESDKKFGHIGLVFSSPDKWELFLPSGLAALTKYGCSGITMGYLDSSDHGQHKNDVSRILHTGDHYYEYWISKDAEGWEQGSMSEHLKELGKLISTGVIPDKAVVASLESACLSLGDCDSKANWIGKSYAVETSGGASEGSAGGGGSMQVPDVVTWTYTFSSGYNLAFVTKSKADAWGEGWVKDSSGNVIKKFSANEQMRHCANRKWPECKKSGVAQFAGNNHGEKLVYTGGGKTLEVYKDGYKVKFDEMFSQSYEHVGNIAGVNLGRPTSLSLEINSQMGVSAAVISGSAVSGTGRIIADAAITGSAVIFTSCVEKSGQTEGENYFGYGIPYYECPVKQRVRDQLVRYQFGSEVEGGFNSSEAKEACDRLCFVESSESQTAPASGGSTSGGGASASGTGKDYSDIFKCEQVNDRNDKILCTLDFKCENYNAPRGGSDCKKCGADSLPCTMYRCMSLGQACQYEEPAGAEKGYCFESGDYNVPKVVKYDINPKGKIPPYTAAEISISTDETSYCRFAVGGDKMYEEMKYDFGENWGFEHKVRLSLPGQIPAENINDYELITRDGIYDMRVKCADVAGNTMRAAYPIRFEVMQTPDTTAPIIEKFEPEGVGVVKYNESSKNIKFRINEPAECAWSSKDEDFGMMINNFTCDNALSDSSALNGYWCEGELSGVDKEKTFYIRCKDQPWLEGNESAIYKRNANSQSKKYVLKPSSSWLKIIELTPTGNIKKSAADSSVTIEARTQGGGYNGAAKCRWKLLNNTSFDYFENTGGTTHSQQTSALTEGDYNIETKCEDDAGNTAEASGGFGLEIDESYPFITRAYNNEGSLNIITSEDSQCNFASDKKTGCGFNFDEGKIMAGAGKEHTIAWEPGKDYYIKCEDYYGNANAGCGIVVRTY